jgi:hypothetical protein
MHMQPVRAMVVGRARGHPAETASETPGRMLQLHNA